MTSERLEAFSDGVIAVIITIMVLELKIPHGADMTALQGLWPTFTAYVLSFINVGIYWNNHHHMFRAVEKIDGRSMWANLHLLFWLSIIPFMTAWIGENHRAAIPTAFYGGVLLCSAIAYIMLQLSLVQRMVPIRRLRERRAPTSKGRRRSPFMSLRFPRRSWPRGSRICFTLSWR